MKNLLSKAADFFTDDDYDEEDYIDENELVQTSRVNRDEIIKEEFDEDGQPIVKTSGLEEALRGKASKVLVMEPKAYSESQEIADHILQNRAVIVNLQRIAPEQGRRIIDFLSGTVYAVNGDLQKISVNTFLCTPDTFGVAGRITEEEAKKVQ